MLISNKAKKKIEMLLLLISSVAFTVISLFCWESLTDYSTLCASTNIACSELADFDRFEQLVYALRSLAVSVSSGLLFAISWRANKQEVRSDAYAS